ncbi:19082_t:CDS:1, partial [Gigaspora rosea]
EKDEKNEIIKKVITTIKRARRELKIIKNDVVKNDEVKLIITMIYKDENRENENSEESGITIIREWNIME